jgi:hypothetical protein
LVQLFESYGDNGDDIYFQYHGFVPSAPESAPHGNDLPEGRNLYECQHVPWVTSSFRPPAAVDGGNKKQRSSTRIVVEGIPLPSHWRPTSEKNNGKGGAASAAGKHAQDMLKRLHLQQLSRGGGICVYHGVVPAHWVTHAFFSLLPSGLFQDGADGAAGPQRNLSSCLRAALDAHDRTVQRGRFNVPLQRTFAALFRSAVKCLNASLRVVSPHSLPPHEVRENDEAEGRRPQTATELLASAMESFYTSMLNHTTIAARAEFSSSNCTRTKQDILNMLSRPISERDGQFWITLQTLRFKAQRQCIVGSLRSAMRKERSKYRKLLLLGATTSAATPTAPTGGNGPTHSSDRPVDEM